MNHAPDSNILEKFYERGASNTDVTALALHRGTRMSYQDLVLDKLIAITHLLDFTKMKGRFSNEYIQQACSMDTTF